MFQISFGLNSRPTTCLGITDDRLKTSLPNIVKKSKNTEIIQEQDCENDDENILKTGVSKVVRFDPLSQNSLNNQDSQYTCNIEDTIIESFVPIPYADDDPVPEVKKPEEDNQKENKESEQQPQVSREEPPVLSPRAIYDNNFNCLVEAVNEIVVTRETAKRGRLDKSYSTPTYDQTEPGLLKYIFINFN